jgi:serine/threonine protein kinase
MELIYQFWDKKLMYLIHDTHETLNMNMNFVSCILNKLNLNGVEYFYNGKMNKNNKIHILRHNNVEYVLKIIEEKDTVLGLDYVINITQCMADLNIGIPIHKCGTLGSFGYIIMSKADNNLDDVYFTNKKYYDETITGMVDKMHEFNVVHGDLNPCNIVILNNRIYFIDFDKAFPLTSISDDKVKQYLSSAYDWTDLPSDFIEYERTQFVQDKI